MDFHNIILPFLATYIIIGKSANFDTQHKLIEHFLTVRNLDSVLLYTCWSFTGNSFKLFS